MAISVDISMRCAWREMIVPVQPGVSLNIWIDESPVASHEAVVTK